MRVVPALDELEDAASCLSPGPERHAIEKFALQGRKEALAQGVIVAVSYRSHRESNPRLVTALPECHSRILRPMVRVMDHFGRTSPPQRHVKRIQHQLSAKVAMLQPTTGRCHASTTTAR